MPLLVAHGDGAVFGAFSGWAFLLRAGQQCLLVAPQLLTGLLLAGLLGTRAGHAWVRRAFGDATIGGMVRASLLGLLTPVGALGALPMATELLRAGVRPATTLCFLITAPLFMPWSLGYTADRVGLLNPLLIATGIFVVALLVGAATRRRTAMQLPGEAPPGTTLLAILRTSARHAAGALLGYGLLSVTVSAGFAAILEPGSIEAYLDADSPSTLFRLSVPLAFANIDSDIAAALAGEFWRIGLLPGGLFVAFYLGAGWCVGTLAWCLHRLRGTGAKASLVWLTATLLVALAGNAILAPERPGEPDSHAFDLLTRPYNLGGSSAADGVLGQWRQTAQGSELAGLAVLLLIVAGFALRLRDSSATEEPEAQAPDAIPPRASPGFTPVLVVALIGYLLAGVYSYYPPVSELEDRLRLHSGNLFEAAVVLESPRRTPEEQATARTLALNALAGIDETLARYPFAAALRLDPPAANRSAPSFATLLEQLERLVVAGPADQIKPTALTLAERLRRPD